MLHVLDTTVLIDHLRGRPAASRIVSLLDAGEVAATTAVNVEEIVRELRSKEVEAARSLFDGLLILRIGQRIGWQAGQWRRDFASRGITLWQADCLVAATAFVHGAVLATGNPKDFPMDGLTVEHWPVGE